MWSLWYALCCVLSFVTDHVLEKICRYLCISSARYTFTKFKLAREDVRREDETIRTGNDRRRRVRRKVQDVEAAMRRKSGERDKMEGRKEERK